MKAWIKTAVDDNGKYRWDLTQNTENIFVTPSDEIVFEESVDDAVNAINRQFDLPYGYIRAYKRNNDVINEDPFPFFPEGSIFMSIHGVEKDFIEELCRAAKINGEVEIERSFYWYEKKKLWENGCVLRKNDDLKSKTKILYKPEEAARYLARRKKAELKTSSKEVEKQAPKIKFLNKHDAYYLCNELKRFGHEFLDINIYGTTMSLCHAIITLKDVWNWRYGKGSYRALPAFKRVKEKWIKAKKSGSKDRRWITDSFIAWMEKEILYTRPPKKKITIKSRVDNWHDIVENSRTKSWPTINLLAVNRHGIEEQK